MTLHSSRSSSQRSCSRRIRWRTSSGGAGTSTHTFHCRREEPSWTYRKRRWCYWTFQQNNLQTFVLGRDVSDQRSKTCFQPTSCAVLRVYLGAICSNALWVHEALSKCKGSGSEMNTSRRKSWNNPQTYAMVGYRTKQTWERHASGHFHMK